MKKISKTVFFVLFAVMIVFSGEVNAIAISLNRSVPTESPLESQKIYSSSIGAASEENQELDESSSENVLEEISDPESKESESQEEENEVTALVDDSEKNEDEVTTVDTSLETRALLPNEKIVNDYNEFRTLVGKKGVEGDRVIDTYYMGNDFTTTTALTVPSGYSFVLDGTNPETGQKQFYDNAAKVSVRAAMGSIPMSVEFRNMHIVGYTTTPVLTAGDANATIIANNISFTGPLLVSHLYGKTIYRDVDINNDGGAYASAIFKGKDLVFEGTSVLSNLDSSSTYAIPNTTGITTFAEGSSVKIDTSTQFLNSSEIEMFEGSHLMINLINSTVSSATILRVMNMKKFTAESARIDVTSVDVSNVVNGYIYGTEFSANNSTFNMQAGQIANFFRTTTTELGTNNEFNLKADNLTTGIFYNADSTLAATEITDSKITTDLKRAGGTILAFKKNVIIDNSELYLKVDDNNAKIITSTGSIDIINDTSLILELDTARSSFFESGTDFKVEDSDFDVLLKSTISTPNRYVVVKAKNASFYNSRVEININDVEFQNVFDVATSFTYVDNGSQDTFFNVRMDTFIRFFTSTKPTVSITAQQINVWEENPNISHVPSEEQMPTARMVKEDYSEATAVFTVDNNGIATFSTNEFDDDATKDLSFNRMMVFSMGSISLDVNNQEGIELLVGMTNQNTAVRFDYNDTLVEEAFSNSEGRIHIPLDPPTKASLQKVQVFSNYLYRYDMADFRKFGKLELKEYPEHIQFGTLKIPQGKTTYDRPEKIRIVVEDTRPEPTAWKLEAKLKKPLSDPTSVHPDIADAIVFKSDPTSQSQILSDLPVEIYSVGEEHEEVTVLEFELNEGILIELNGAGGIFKDVNYEAEIEWILTEY